MAATSAAKLVDLDDAIAAIGVGTYQYRLLGVIAVLVMTEAMEVNLLAFLSPCVADAWSLGAVDEASLSSVVFGCSLLGTFFFGWCADRHGRWTVALACAFLNASCGVLSSSAGRFWVLVAFRGAVGFSLGGTMQPYVMLLEYLPARTRGSWAMLCSSMAWVLGSMFVYAAAWAVLSVEGWRALVLICALPGWLAFGGLWMLHESPRWLLSQGRAAEALRVLRAIAATNGGGAFEADEITLGGRGGDEREAASARASVGELLAPSQRATTLTLWALWSCFGFSYYGVVLLISEAFNNASGDDDTSCSGFNYAFLFVVATAEGVGDAIAMLCIDTFGRRRLQVLAYLVTALATIVLAVGVDGRGAIGKMSSGFLLPVAMLARATNGASTSASWVHTPELIPTSLRGFGSGACLAFNSIGNMSVCYWIWDSGASFFVRGMLVASCALAAATLAAMLPRETAGEPLTEGRQVDAALLAHPGGSSRSQERALL